MIKRKEKLTTALAAIMLLMGLLMLAGIWFLLTR